MRLTRRVAQTVGANMTTLTVFYGAFWVTGQCLLPFLAARGVTFPVWLEVAPC